MTKQELLKAIKDILWNPQAWVDAGLGHNTVAKVEVWIDERARNIVQAIGDLLPESPEQTRYVPGSSDDVCPSCKRPAERCSCQIGGAR